METDFFSGIVQLSGDRAQRPRGTARNCRDDKVGSRLHHGAFREGVVDPSPQRPASEINPDGHLVMQFNPLRGCCRGGRQRVGRVVEDFVQRDDAVRCGMGSQGTGKHCHSRDQPAEEGGHTLGGKGARQPVAGWTNHPPGGGAASGKQPIVVPWSGINDGGGIAGWCRAGQGGCWPVRGWHGARCCQKAVNCPRRLRGWRYSGSGCCCWRQNRS